MDVYKKSPLGKIPNDWEVLSTDDIGEITSSKRVHRADYTKNGVPFFRGKEISQLAKGDKLSDIVYIKTETYNELKSKFGAPESGDILITAVGTIGSIYLVKEGDKFYFKDGNLMWIRNISDRLNRRFLMHYLRSSIFQNVMDLASGGSSQKALTIVKFKRLFIPVPNELEQQKIAEILSTVDAKINVIDQQITEIQELKKGLMQRLLTKGIGHTEFKDSPLGKIPKSWDTAILSDLTSLITKGTTPTTNGFSYLDDGVNFVKVESIHSNGNFIPSMFAHVGNDCHNSFKRSQLSEGDILFTIAGALGRSAIVIKEILPANTNQAVAVIRLKNGDNRNYIFHYLRGNYVKRLIEKINVSTAQANLSLGQINKFKIPIPPPYEQHKIAEILNSVDKKLEILNEKKTNYQELKQGLMQQLLTGKVRVKLKSTVSA